MSEDRTTAQQLRALSNGWDKPTEVILLADKAANELERMRVALERITCTAGHGTHRRMRAVAREALKEQR